MVRCVWGLLESWLLELPLKAEDLHNQGSFWGDTIMPGTVGFRTTEGTHLEGCLKMKSNLVEWTGGIEMKCRLLLGG